MKIQPLFKPSLVWLHESQMAYLLMESSIRGFFRNKRYHLSLSVIVAKPTSLPAHTFPHPHSFTHNPPRNENNHDPSASRKTCHRSSATSTKRRSTWGPTTVPPLFEIPRTFVSPPSPIPFAGVRSTTTVTDSSHRPSSKRSGSTRTQ